MKKRWYFFRTGGFSGINDSLLAALRKEFSDFELVEVDLVRDIVRPSSLLHGRALLEAFWRYGKRIARTHVPPRDFFPRLPRILAAVSGWTQARVDPGSTAFTFQTQSLFDASRAGVPHFLYTDHTYLANRRYAGQAKPALPVGRPWLAMERELYRHETFTSSEFAARSVIEDYQAPAARVHTVHSGLNTPFPETVDATERRGNRILFVAVEWERKGGPDLWEAFLQVAPSFPDAELHVVGCLPPVKHPRVIAYGRVSIDDVARHYARADIFCLPSRVDPSASVLAEAASFALPVVATSVGGNGERVLDGKTGFLVPPGDPAALAGALHRLLAEAALRRGMGEAGRTLVREKFTWSAVAGKIATVIRARLS